MVRFVLRRASHLLLASIAKIALIRFVPTKSSPQSLTLLARRSFPSPSHLRSRTLLPISSISLLPLLLAYSNQSQHPAPSGLKYVCTSRAFVGRTRQRRRPRRMGQGRGMTAARQLYSRTRATPRLLISLHPASRMRADSPARADARCKS